MDDLDKPKEESFLKLPEEENRTVVWQKQPNENVCTQTCVAMLKGIPVQEVVDEFPGTITNLTVRNLMSHYQIAYMSIPVAIFPSLPGYYLIQYAIEYNVGHSVILQVIGNGRFNLWDPNLGEYLDRRTPPRALITDAFWIIPDQLMKGRRKS